MLWSLYSSARLWSCLPTRIIVVAFLRLQAELFVGCMFVQKIRRQVPKTLSLLGRRVWKSRRWVWLLQFGGHRNWRRYICWRFWRILKSQLIRIVTFVGIFCIKFSLWHDRILDIFFVIFRHFVPLNAIYENLSFILEFCDPENPYFDVWYFDVEKYWKKVWNLGNSSFVWHFFLSLVAIHMQCMVF